LRAAIDCFWHRGYEATSVRDLADKMRISAPSLYNTYGDKRALFKRALGALSRLLGAGADHAA